jgi:hypothetical protein
MKIDSRSHFSIVMSFARLSIGSTAWIEHDVVTASFVGIVYRIDFVRRKTAIFVVFSKRAGNTLQPLAMTVWSITFSTHLVKGYLLK